MKTRIKLLAIASLQLASAAHAAASDLTGSWQGSFNGVKTAALMAGGFPLGRPWEIPFGHQGGAAPAPIEAPIRVEIASQQNGITLGSWRMDELSGNFACTQVTDSLMGCSESGGLAHVEVVATDSLKLCYLGTGAGSPGVGCATVTRGPVDTRAALN
jgi:hypothetical protein